MSQPERVRVRLAPSPTGTPHLGTARTALFDWLLARSTGGTFILRIEDTDQNRYVPESLDYILESLRWLGLDWDEGPDVGGPHAPYSQSERLDLYQAAARRLVDSGHAFECYCSPQRLDAMRNRQRELKQPPGYDGLCKSEAGRAQARRESGSDKFVIRFNAPDEGETVVPDVVRGDVTFENARIDDAVLLKSDGFPTYHLAVAVDDHEMEITHIIRNEEWLPSAPLHVMVFKALGYELPVLIHTASILGPDRAKLSKRHGAMSVLEYRDIGYLPEALFNYLGLLGWSLDDKTEIISRREFVDNFSIERLLKSPAVFNAEKLDWMNAEYMRSLPDERFIDVVSAWLEKPEAEGGLPAIVQRPLDRDFTRRLLPLVKERVKLASRARETMDFYYIPDGLELDAVDLLGKTFKDDRAQAALLLSEALVLAEQTPAWQHESLEQAYRALADRLEVKFRDFTAPIRVAITSRSVSPPLFESMEILGRDVCVLRLRQAVQLLQ
jgi:glutamyl-tRNA synthetase